MNEGKFQEGRMKQRDRHEQEMEEKKEQLEGRRNRK